MDNEQDPPFPQTRHAGDEWRSSTASSREAPPVRRSTLSVNSSRLSHVSSIFSRDTQRDSVASTSTDISSHPRSSTASITSACCPPTVPEEPYHLPMHQSSTPDSSTSTTTSTRTSTAKHNKGDNKFKCLHCEETFSKATDQKKHLKDRCQSLGAGSAAYRCQTCPSLSMTISQAAKHQKDDHPNRLKKPGFEQIKLPAKHRFTCGRHRQIFPTLERYTIHADYAYSTCVTIGNHDHHFRLRTLLEEGKSTSYAPHTGTYMEMVNYWQSCGCGHLPNDLLQLLTDTYTNHEAQTLADKLEWGVVNNKDLHRAGRAFRSVQELLDQVVDPLVLQYTASHNNQLGNTQSWHQSQGSHDPQASLSLPGPLAIAAATSAFTSNASTHSFMHGNTRLYTGSDPAEMIQGQGSTIKPPNLGLSSAFQLGDTSPTEHVGSEAPQLSTSNILELDDSNTFAPMPAQAPTRSNSLYGTETPGLSWPRRKESLHLQGGQVMEGIHSTSSAKPPSSHITPPMYNLPADSMAHNRLNPNELVAETPNLAQSSKRPRPLSTLSTVSDGAARGAPIPRQGSPTNDTTNVSTLSTHHTCHDQEDPASNSPEDSSNPSSRRLPTRTVSRQSVLSTPTPPPPPPTPQPNDLEAWFDDFLSHYDVPDDMMYNGYLRP